jgi:hypothetical protein
MKLLKFKLLIITFLFSNALFSEQEEYIQPKELSNQQKEELAKAIGVDPNDKKFLEWVNNTKSYDENLLKELPEAQVIKHLKGDEGIAFPKREDMEKYYEEKYGKEIPYNEEKEVKKLQKEAQKELKEQLTPIKFEACKLSTKENQVIADPNSSNAKDLEMDLLFIAEEDLPKTNTDYFELFGKKTDLKIISKWSLGIQQAAKSININCLPTRFRATKSVVFQEQGAYALRNYDKDPHGEGEVHVTIQEVASKYRLQ